MELILNSLIEALADGKWHHLTEISAKAKPLRKVSITNLATSLHLLSEYDFIELGEEPHFILEARINPILQAFWRKIKWIERAEKEHRIFKPNLFLG